MMNVMNVTPIITKTSPTRRRITQRTPNRRVANTSNASTARPRITGTAPERKSPILYLPWRLSHRMVQRCARGVAMRRSGIDDEIRLVRIPHLTKRRCERRRRQSHGCGPASPSTTRQTSAWALALHVDGILPVGQRGVARGILAIPCDLAPAEEPDRDLLVRDNPADLVNHHLLGLIVQLEALRLILLDIGLIHQVIGWRVVDVLHVHR